MQPKPLQNGEGPCNYVAGWNTPGYAATMQPEFFTDFDSAKRWLIHAIKQEELMVEIDGDETMACRLCHLAEDINLLSEPFTTDCIGGVVYWVETT